MLSVADSLCVAVHCFDTSQLRTSHSASLHSLFPCTPAESPSSGQLNTLDTQHNTSLLLMTGELNFKPNQSKKYQNRPNTITKIHILTKDHQKFQLLKKSKLNYRNKNSFDFQLYKNFFTPCCKILDKNKQANVKLLRCWPGSKPGLLSSQACV